MHRYLLVLALVLLLAADLGWKAWSERPYVVTATGIDAVGDNRSSNYVEYRVPGGGTGRWATTDKTTLAIYECWLIARVGSTIPTCMRSWNEIGKGR